MQNDCRRVRFQVDRMDYCNALNDGISVSTWFPSNDAILNSEFNMCSLKANLRKKIPNDRFWEFQENTWEFD